MSPRKRLPSRLSALLDLAVDDAMALERRKGFRLFMFQWVAQAGDGVCEVCMAGAVMVRSLGVRLTAATHAIGPGAGPTGVRLHAINLMREGLLPNPWEGATPSVQYEFWRIVGYHEEQDGRVPWPRYRAAAAYLRAVGL